MTALAAPSSQGAASPDQTRFAQVPNDRSALSVQPILNEYFTDSKWKLDRFDAVVSYT
jgi:hypothetical protein